MENGSELFTPRLSRVVPGQEALAGLQQILLAHDVVAVVAAIDRIGFMFGNGHSNLPRNARRFHARHRGPAQIV